MWVGGTRKRRACCFFPLRLLTFVGVVVTDLFDGVPHHLLVVHIGPRRDLTTEQHHSSLTHRFCKVKSIKLDHFYPMTGV